MGKHVKTGERIKQNHLGSKNGCSNNKEITKGDNSGDRKSRKEIGVIHVSITNRTQEIEEKYQVQKMP